MGEQNNMSTKLYLQHSGTPQKFDFDPNGSGRYRQGSGENPHQHGFDFLYEVEKLRKTGMTNTEIARAMGYSTGEWRAKLTNMKAEKYAYDAARVAHMRYDRQMSNTAIAEKLGMELEIKDMEFDSLLTAVQSKTIDVALAGMTVTDERKLAVNFSDTYATGVQVIIVNENSDIKNVDGLKNKKIGVQAGTTGDIYCTDEFGQENVKQYQNGALAVAALKNNQVDCVVIDNEPAKNYVKANAGLKILETEYAVEDYAAAISKENTELLENFNKALSELKADGTIDRIIKKYIPAE